MLSDRSPSLPTTNKIQKGQKIIVLQAVASIELIINLYSYNVCICLFVCVGFNEI